MSPRILVVDDESAVLDVLVRILTREGYSVRGAGGGEQGLLEAVTDPPDLLLLDVTMPGLDGFEVCRRIREDPRLELLPIAMITALSDSASRIRGLDAGADDFVSKPFEVPVLLARIRSLLRVKRLTDQLESTERVVFALARTVAARDEYTDGHLTRLAHYGVALARALGLDEHERRCVFYTGILHDIGKIGIPEAVLKKPSALTAAEFEEMKRHPDIGAEIVAPMRFAPSVGPAVRSHHERWDGRGYPQGLAGEDIPLAARVIAVVDAWDAMTTDRPYRTALPTAEAFRRLRAGAGEQWDPRVVDTFVRMLEAEDLPAILVEAPRRLAS